MLLSSLTILLAQAGRPGQPSGGDASCLGGMGIFGIFCCCFGVVLLLGLVPVAGAWKAFAKAGEPGWAALIPIYGFPITFCKIAGKDEMRWLFHLIPIANIYFAIVDTIDFCKAYGKETGFAIGMILLPFIFWPILGFGSARYVGAPASGARRVRYEDEEDLPPRRRQRDEDEDEPPRRRRREDDM